MSRYGVFLSTTLCFVAGILSAPAGADGRLYRHHGPHCNALHRSIYKLENQYAAVKEDPEIGPDDVSSSAVPELGPRSHQ